MKLSPPGSSSDLAAARAIAHRLHQRALASKAADAGPAPPDPLSETQAVRRPAPPPLPTRPPAPPVVRPAPPPHQRPVDPTPPAIDSEERPRSEAPPPREARTAEAEPPVPAEREQHGYERWADTSPDTHPGSSDEDDVAEGFERKEPAAARDGRERIADLEHHDDDELAELTEGDGGDLDVLGTAGPAPAGGETGIAEPSFEEPGAYESSFEPPGLDVPSFDEPGLEEPSLEAPSAGAVNDGLDLDGPGGEAPAYEPQADEETLFEEPATSAEEVSPEDLIGSPTEAPEVWSEPALTPEFEAPGAAEDLVELAGPAWDDVTDTCLMLAGAHGAMLVAASGSVLSARGDWPNPGPEAIAGRLVTMMERALRDAPTRSVSAPLAGQHLTAWRVPVADGMHTAVFIGDSPLKADVRPAIDHEIRQAAGV